VPGAASARIETARRYFSRIFFNADITEGGRDAIGWYHEKRPNVWLGQNHDWSSHGADGFGLMCIHYDLPEGAPRLPERYRVGEELGGRGFWQARKPLASRK
jgi:phage terminase large subunit